MTINRFSKLFMIAFAIAVVGFSACKKEEVDEQENLNVLKIKIGATTFTWSDTDGAGGVAPKIDTIRLTPNGTFASEITIQDGSANPVKDLTPEIITKKK